jgi:phenylacetate-CoA ligase
MINKRLQDYFSIVKESSLFKGYYNNIDKDSNIPPIEKHTLREILSTKFNLHSESKGVYLVRSGGSTDKPLIFPVDIKENLYQRELIAAELVRYGMFSSKTIALNLFSYSTMYRSASILDDILERCDATTIATGSNASYEFMHTAVLEFKPNILIGTPSVFTLLANYLLDKNLSIEVDELMYAGEYLLKSQVELFKKVFNIKRIYSLYGAAETGIWGWSTYSETGMSFEVLDDIIIEIEDPDEEGVGKVLVTNLLRERFPLFRYFVGDIGRLEYKNNKQFLTLKSRGSKSFSILANSYFSTDFDVLLESVDRFQIQLSMKEAFQTELKFLLIKADCNEEEAKAILKKVNKELSLVLERSPALLNVKVAIASESDLYSDPTTSKTPLIKDFRN